MPQREDDDGNGDVDKKDGCSVLKWEKPQELNQNAPEGNQKHEKKYELPNSARNYFRRRSGESQRNPSHRRQQQYIEQNGHEIVRAGEGGLHVKSIGRIQQVLPCFYEA